MIYPMKAFYNPIAAVYHKNDIRIAPECLRNIFGNFYGTYGIAKSTYLPDFLL